MTDNMALIIIAIVTGVPATVAAVNTAMVSRRQAVTHRTAVATEEKVVATQATVAATKTSVENVEHLVNSTTSQLREELKLANARIEALISRLPREINGHTQ